MIVVADTGPLNYLLLLDRITILPVLYHAVFVPQAVVQELSHVRAPEATRRWIAAPPSWLKIRDAGPLDQTLQIGLGSGEREAISLALLIKADRILVDDREARVAAEERSLEATGTLTILSAAAGLGLLKLPETMQQLLTLRFRASPELVARVLRAGESRSG